MNKYFKLTGILFLVIFIASCGTSGQRNGEGDMDITSFKVYGNCSMCEDRIETAALSVAGVDSVSWNVKTEELWVRYNKAEADNADIHKAIAMAGHDTEMMTADDHAYENLPDCCRYRDDEEHQGQHEDHDDHEMMN